MSESEHYLEKLARLRIDRSKGPAPHKPLLLLVVIELAEQGLLTSARLDLTPDLAFRFFTYWGIVAHRRNQPPDVRLPLHHMGSDGLWAPRMTNGEPSPDRRLTAFVEIDQAFLAYLQSPEWRSQAKRLLIGLYFEPAERLALYTLCGVRAPDDDAAMDEPELLRRNAKTRGREARFRLDVVNAYNYTCALTGYRVTTISGGAIVDAAHIHGFAKSRNNDPQNGIALCKNAHWLFDNGLWSLTDDYCVIVARDHFDEASPDQRSLAEYHGQQIRLPADASIWPDPRHIAWHRTNRLLRLGK